MTGLAHLPAKAPAPGAARSVHSAGLSTGQTTTFVAAASGLSAGPESVSSNSAPGAPALGVVFETLRDAVDVSVELMKVTVGSAPTKATERLPALTDPVAVTRALQAAIAEELLASADKTNSDASDNDSIEILRPFVFISFSLRTA
ncbi:MAG: hypothetical protein ACHP7F_02060 [Actinomycetales bacterium]